MFRSDCSPTNLKLEGNSRLIATYDNGSRIEFTPVISTARDIRNVSISEVTTLRKGERFSIKGSSSVFQNGDCNTARIIDIRPWLRTDRPCLDGDRQGTFGHYSYQYNLVAAYKT